MFRTCPLQSCIDPSSHALVNILIYIIWLFGYRLVYECAISIPLVAEPPLAAQLAALQIGGERIYSCPESREAHMRHTYWRTFDPRGRNQKGHRDACVSDSLLCINGGESEKPCISVTLLVSRKNGARTSRTPEFIPSFRPGAPRTRSPPAIPNVQFGSTSSDHLPNTSPPGLPLCRPGPGRPVSRRRRWSAAPKSSTATGSLPPCWAEPGPAQTGGRGGGGRETPGDAEATVAPEWAVLLFWMAMKRRIRGWAGVVWHGEDALIGMSFFFVGGFNGFNL